MINHKLFCGSSHSPDLNSSMEIDAGKGVNPPRSPSPKRKKITLANKNGTQRNDIKTCFSQSGSLSDDSMDEKNFFSEKKAYSFNEDVEIVNFVLKDQNIYRVSSVLLWKYLEVKKSKPKRTYQSLKNRFLRNIKPKLFTSYRHLIQNEDQVKKILDKFPELRKDAMKTESVLQLNLPPRKAINKFSITNLSNSPSKVTTPKPVKTSSIPVISLAAESDVEEECGTRQVSFFNNNIQVTIQRKLVNDVQVSSNNFGIYEKYLTLKAKNKLVPCPTCGRCGGPELNEVQGGENENDLFIFNSIRNENSKSCESSINPRTEECSRKDRKVAVTNVQSNKHRRRSPQPEKSSKPPLSPSLLGGNKTPKTENVETERRDYARRSKERPPQITELEKINNKPLVQIRRMGNESCNIKTLVIQGSEFSTRINECAPQSKVSEDSTTGNVISSSAYKKKDLTSVEHHSEPLEDVTDEELESLYQETVQECQNLISSEEEEALVKKCFKKNRRSIGFDSYLMLNKCSLDSFFAKSQSPPLDSLSTDAATSADSKSEKSPLVENMKKMLRPREVKNF